MTGNVPAAGRSWLDRLPVPLLDAVLEGRCVAFIGSGLSTAGVRSDGRPLPQWKEFIRELIESAEGRWIDADRAAELRVAVDAGALLEVAGELQSSFPIEALQKFFLGVFGDPALRPSAIHSYLTQIRLRAALTSNYDSLLEDAFGRANARKPLTFTFGEYPTIRCPIRDARFFILKIHGDYRNVSEIVLGLRDYQDIIHHHPLSRQLLSNIFASNTVVFIGCGGDDPDLDDILNSISAVLRRSSEPHYLVVPHGRFSAPIKRRLLVDKRLEVIEYDPVDGHRELANILGQLRHSSLLNHFLRRTPTIRVMVAAHHEDRGRLADVFEVLENRGFATYWHNLEELWTANGLTRARAGIEKCGLLVHVTSRNYRREFDLAVAMAHEAARPITPLLLDGVSAPEALRRFISFRLCETNRAKSIGALVDLIAVQTGQDDQVEESNDGQQV